jgi:hypothetical protein
LGSGDIGNVYLAELSGTRTSFAVKLMNKTELACRKNSELSDIISFVQSSKSESLVSLGIAILQVFVMFELKIYVFKF